jgi:hypothetical protein
MAMLLELEHLIFWHTILSARRLNVCFWHKADIETALRNVRFRGQSGHRNLRARVCFAQSGHRGNPEPSPLFREQLVRVALNYQIPLI